MLISDEVNSTDPSIVSLVHLIDDGVPLLVPVWDLLLQVLEAEEAAQDLWVLVQNRGE